MAIPTHRIDIYWWASPLPVDMPSWCETFFSTVTPLKPTTIFYSTFMLYPWFTLTYCASNKKLKHIKKYDPIAWLDTMVLDICIYGVKTEPCYFDMIKWIGGEHSFWIVYFETWWLCFLCLWILLCWCLLIHRFSMNKPAIDYMLGSMSHKIFLFLSFTYLRTSMN